MSDIKSMGLYRQVDRILADLEAAGIGAGDRLVVDDLTPFDQYHYEGTSAVDDAIESIGADSKSRILDIGAGLGGPSRYLADRSGARVVALELQADLHQTGQELTRRCGLEASVHHLHGDVLDDVVAPADFTAIVSMLCFLHIPDRSDLFQRCARLLRSPGIMFIDDYFRRGPFSDADTNALAEKVYCPYLPDLDTYVDDLHRAGFVEVRTVDKTADWRRFVVDRAAMFEAARRDLIPRYGAETVASLGDFYSTVAALFTNGSLGGLRLVAHKP